MATTTCPAGHSCPLCDSAMAKIARMTTRSLAAFNSVRTSDGLRTTSGRQQAMKFSQETPEQRTARLTGFFGTPKPRAATVEPRPKAAPAMPSMVDRIKANAVGSMRELPSAGNLQPAFPARVPEAEAFNRPIAQHGTLTQSAPAMPSWVDAIKANRRK